MGRNCDVAFVIDGGRGGDMAWRRLFDTSKWDGEPLDTH